ncbi:hypothetical protein [Sphingobacterium sp. UME9]|uniref:hypothetical protein n=1 Tax=Sphingobacterium sp. UME9 TaxID=1862316 RepID=UPI0016023512|nr:hypothetical protein [Sphingobacterium sp. UME9]MBB1643041.1 hypothetical protein [Sphingobacterium sp. UME9]
MRKILILFALFLFAQSNSAKAQSIKGCITAFFNDVQSSSTTASGDYRNCISKVPGSGGGGAGAGPDLDHDEGPGEEPDFEFPHYTFAEILEKSNISYISSPSDQIADFENMYGTALTIIRTVNVVGMNPYDALGKYIGYIIDNNLTHIFYTNVHGTLYPGIALEVLYNYVNYGNSVIPASWASLGYSLN